MKKLISAVLFASAAVLPSFAQADNYPSDAVTIVVPYPPGGTTDLLARLVAKGLGERTDQAFIVRNTPGAGGQVGSRQVAQSKPDGYTLVMGKIGRASCRAQGESSAGRVACGQEGRESSE